MVFVMVTYPAVDKIVEFNSLALNVIRVKKADSAKVLSRGKISGVLDSCKKTKGTPHDKAVVLLKGRVQGHPFASGNRRTAFIAMKYFLVMDKGRLCIADDPKNARVMPGIREGYCSDKEIKEWIKNGKIREFKRQAAL